MNNYSYSFLKSPEQSDFAVGRDDDSDESQAPDSQSAFAQSLSQFSCQSEPGLKRKSPFHPSTPTRAKRITRSTSSLFTAKLPDGTSFHEGRAHSKRKVTRPAFFQSWPARSTIINRLKDSLEPDLIIMFVGTNPGLSTATSGHAYAHPSNLYWKLLHASGLTKRRLDPSEDQELPRLYRYGNTNIVPRPTRDASMVSNDEFDAGVTMLEEKCRKWRPEVVVLVGKSIWETIVRVWKGRAISKGEFKYGWQVEERIGKEKKQGGWQGSRIFVATTTSGLAASMSYEEKLRVWKELRDWVDLRREERRFKGLPIGEEVDPDERRRSKMQNECQ